MAGSVIRICLLPDNIILEILSYLPVSDRCVSGSVCRRWRRIVQDNSLWRHVDLLPYDLSLQKLWKVVRAHFSECLLTMKLRGFWDPNSIKWKKHSLSDPMLEELADRCPNIRTLTLVKCNTDNLDCNKLPKSLRHLTMRKCSWKPRWLKSVTDLDLISLDLSGCSRVDNFDVMDIVEKFPNLVHLTLNNCYRVAESGIEKVAQSLLSIVSLSLSYTSCSDLSIHHIMRNLSHLTNLNVSHCGQLTPSCLGSITGKTGNLTFLDISGNSSFTVDHLKQLKHCSSLCKIRFGSSTNDNFDRESLTTFFGESVNLDIVTENLS